MRCAQSVILFFIIVYLSFTYSYLRKRTGDKCANINNVDGVCTLASDCEVAIRLIKNNMYHNFTRCGFHNFTEILCCPETSNKFGSTTETVHRQVTEPSRQTRTAVRECDKLTLQSPIGLHIIGGIEASIGEFPHMVNLMNEDIMYFESQGKKLIIHNREYVALGFQRDSGFAFDCGGTLVSKVFVLTAAHCVRTKDRIEPSIVRVGVIELNSTSFDSNTDFVIEEIIAHPEYRTSQNYHDLALLRLQNEVEFSGNVNAACIYAEAEDPKIALAITGWGQTDAQRDNRSSTLLKAEVTVVAKDKCGESYKNWRKLPNGVSQEQICAGDPEGERDTCQGDSGGPLQGLTGKDNKYRIVGITSFGRGCGSVIPGVYTRVSHYIDWIESVVWPN